jgi:glycerate 2-kinase
VEEAVRRLRRAIAGAGGMKKDALTAVSAALRASDPARLVRGAVSLEGRKLKVGRWERDLGDYGRVVAIGGGKASGLMAVGLEAALEGRLSEGVVIVPDYQRKLPRLPGVRFVASTHPHPSVKGARAVGTMLRVLEGVGEGDLVVALISGGGSAMMPAPPEGVSIGELDRTSSLLLEGGASIREINTVRKHLSGVAGGRLAEKTGGAEVLALVTSDVVGDDLSSVASGPTVADPTSYGDALRILKARKLWTKVPSSVRKVIQSGVDGVIRDTPKPGDPIFGRVSNILVGSNAVAASAAKESLEDLGYRVTVSESVTGEARAVGRRLARGALRARTSGPHAMVWGGESTVTVRGRGMGGRNQELALAAAIELEGASDVAVLSFGTDGVDGPTEAAGAYADSSTLSRARTLGLDPQRSLLDNDSHSFFRKLGDLVVCGPTGTNVNDVMVALRA